MQGIYPSESLLKGIKDEENGKNKAVIAEKCPVIPGKTPRYFA